MDTSNIKIGSRLLANNAVMVVTGETKTHYQGYMEHSGNKRTSCSLPKVDLSNWHLSDVKILVNMDDVDVDNSLVMKYRICEIANRIAKEQFMNFPDYDESMPIDDLPSALAVIIESSEEPTKKLDFSDLFDYLSGCLSKSG